VSFEIDSDFWVLERWKKKRGGGYYCEKMVGAGLELWWIPFIWYL